MPRLHAADGCSLPVASVSNPFGTSHVTPPAWLTSGAHSRKAAACVFSPACFRFGHWSSLSSPIFAPTSFTPVIPYVTYLLALIMFAAGVTLRVSDFRRVITRPGPVLAGLGLHYLIMPFAAWAIARMLGMPPELAAGMILVGSVASGTSSTVMVFLSGGDVALSVTISSLSTLVGIVATPLLTRLYVSAGITVDVWGLLSSIVQVVAVPVLLGLGGQPPRAPSWCAGSSLCCP